MGKSGARLREVRSFGRRGVSTYEEMAPERTKARALYLELTALRVRLRLREDPHDPAGYKMGLSRLHSVPKADRGEIRRRVEANEPGLLKVLLSRRDSGGTA